MKCDRQSPGGMGTSLAIVRLVALAAIVGGAGCRQRSPAADPAVAAERTERTEGADAMDATDRADGTDAADEPDGQNGADGQDGADRSDAGLRASSHDGPVIFRDITAEAGLDFQHFNGATGERRFPEIMGAGCALLDYDLDGDLDVYAIQGAWLAPGTPITAPRDPGPPVNRLYRNDTAADEHGRPRVRFTDVTEGSGLGDTGFGMGCAVGDYDNDGDPDVYVTNFGSNALYRNNGDGTFTDRTAASGTDDPRWSASAAFVDYDADGHLDLVLTNYVLYDANTTRSCISFHTGAPDYCVPSDFPPAPDSLFRNRGDGTFENVTESSGLSAAFGRGLGVVSADLDGDGLIDIYVANDESPNQLWINQGDGTFTDRALMAGAALSSEGKVQGGMGVLAEDFDRDGDNDLFISHFLDESNTLYSNDGHGTFEDRSYVSGLGFASQPMTGFGTVAVDYDNDGWQDIFVANGAVLAVESQLGKPFPYALENQLFRNQGQAFELVNVRPDSPVLDSDVSRGTAMGDIDNDGDTDLLISNNNGPLQLLRNEVGQDANRVTLLLVGTVSHRDALGAVVLLERSNGAVLQRRVARDGSYCSASDPRVTFGLGDVDAVTRVTVRWPNGALESWATIPVNRQTQLTEGQGHTERRP